jgi:N-acetylmuramoyl-L-alanine amidase
VNLSTTRRLRCKVNTEEIVGGFRGKILIAAMTAGCAMAARCETPARSGNPGPFTVLLDPGHTPKTGGATSVRGIKEVAYFAP